MAKEGGRPYRYLPGPARKEDLAREIAEKDGVTNGLVCVFSVVEPCKTFSMVWKGGKSFIRPARRKCLFLYYYFIDREGRVPLRGEIRWPQLPADSRLPV
jgi:hypothetical protein